MDIMDKALEVAEKRAQFDKIWKIALIIVLIVGMVYMFWEFSQINKEGLACKSAPFKWGVEKAKESGLSCYYSCSEGESFFNYSVPLK